MDWFDVKRKHSVYRLVEITGEVMRKKIWIFGIVIMLAYNVKAEPPYIPISGSFENDGNQFHVKSAVLNTPVIKATITQGTNRFNVAGYTWRFRFGRNENVDSMTTITGCVATNDDGLLPTNVVNFAVGTNSFAAPVANWYAAILCTSGTVVNSQIKGQISIDRSPEVDAPQSFAATYAINGSNYSPFTGDFSSWPFPTNGLTVTNTWVDVNYTTNVQTFYNGALYRWTTNGIVLP